jgi:hypothetical protein
LLNGGQGLTFLNETNFTTQATVNVDSLITSTYRNYKVLINVIGFNGTLRMQMRKAAVTTTAGYYAAGWGVDYAGSQANQGLVNNGASWIVGTVGAASNGNFSLDLLDAIASSGYTTFVGMTHYTGSAQTGFNGGAVPANVFTGLSLSTSSGTMTGTIRIYGYRNS